MKFFKNDPRRAYFKKINEDNVIVADRIDFLFIRYTFGLSKILILRIKVKMHTRVYFCSNVAKCVYICIFTGIIGWRWKDNVCRRKINLFSPGVLKRDPFDRMTLHDAVRNSIIHNIATSGGEKAKLLINTQWRTRVILSWHQSSDRFY